MHPPCQEAFKHSIPALPSIDLFRPLAEVVEQFDPGRSRRAYNERINVREDVSPRLDAFY